MPEAIYGASKTPDQIARIVERNRRAMVTRASREAMAAVREKHPEIKDFDVARMIAVGEFPPPRSRSRHRQARHR